MVDKRVLLTACLLLLAACGSRGGDLPGDPQSHEPFAGIGESELVRFTGTEPFWGGEVGGGTLRWSTPERPDGVTIAVTRRAGRNGLSFSGTLDDAPFILAVTEQACSDGMSDRQYPFAATVQLGEQTLRGCAWSTAYPFSGSESP